MIPISRDSDPDPTGRERCCFCRTPTFFWTVLSGRKPGQQVACCDICASRGEPKDVPSKTDWLRRERIAHRPTIGEIAMGHDKNHPPAQILRDQP